MAKKYIKATQSKRKPGYRTADFYKGKTFKSSGVRPGGFNSSKFKVQHKG